MHDDSDSRIWEAVSVDCKRTCCILKQWEGTAASCLHRWLSARAPGLRQLSFCYRCSCVEADTSEEVGDATPALAVPAVALLVTADD